MNRHPFINPFRYIAGWKALAIGWVIILATALTAWQSGTHFDGVLDVHLGKGGSLMLYFAEQLVNWLCMVLFFYLSALVLSGRGFRLIDIAGTMAFARAPMLPVAFLGFVIPPVPDNIQNIEPSYLMAGLLALVPVIWMVMWMYQAFITSTNLKGAKAVAGFVITLILAEIASKLIFSLAVFSQ